MRIALIIGCILLACDLVLLLYWLVFTAVVGIHDAHNTEKYLPAHMTTAFHFTATVVICLILEAFDTFRTLERARPVDTSVGFLFSWSIALMVVFGTDISALLHLAIIWDTENNVWQGEFLISVWCLVNIVLTIGWSVWILTLQLIRNVREGKTT